MTNKEPDDMHIAMTLMTSSMRIYAVAFKANHTPKDLLEDFVKTAVIQFRNEVIAINNTEISKILTTRHESREPTHVSTRNAGNPRTTPRKQY